MYLTLIVLPLVGFLITCFFGRFIGGYGSCMVALICVSVSMVLSWIGFIEIVYFNSSILINICPWISSGILQLNWSFLFDTLTTVMLIVVTSISTLVHLYSIYYMLQDPHLPRFMSFLEIFTFFMLVLVTSDNLVQMFLGWEGVGLSSYLLINFWFTRLAANKASLKALLINRIGDLGILLGIFWVFIVFRSFDYFTIFSLVPSFINHTCVLLNFKLNSLTLIGICLVIGAMGKSAQIGLHTWLPDAMEGPTPVSALIHAATMVTAGVFIVIRFSPLIEFSNMVLSILVILGSLTAFFSALTGIFQHDLKKIIAYSTCSQLGYMILCCGLSNYDVSIFHLVNHAFFKALLFLGSGSVIHAIANEQDIRRMGSLISFMPISYSLMLIGSLALIGMPFLTGFYSKDIILELTNIFRNFNSTSLKFIAFWFGNITVLLTAYYSSRLLLLAFLNNASFSRRIYIHESSFYLLLPLFILFAGSIFGGYLFKDLFIGLGNSTWGISIFNYPQNTYVIESEFLFTYLKWVPFLLSMLGVLFAIFLNNFNFFINMSFILPFFFFVNKKWFFDSVYNRSLVFPLLNFGYITSFQSLDRGFIELAGPYGISTIVKLLAFKFSSLHTGQIVHYIFIIFTCACLLKYIYYIYDLYLFLFYFLLVFFI